MTSKTTDIKMLALDLDGTLTNAKKEITPRVRESIRKAVDKGVVVILASGRPLVGMAHVADELGLDETGGYLLSNNGSKIVEWKSKETVFEAMLPSETVGIACKAADEHGATALVYDEKGLYSEDIAAKYVEKERYNNSATATEVESLVDKVTWDPNKIMVVGEPCDLAGALSDLEKELEGEADVFLSEPYFIEITPRGIRKDAALVKLAAILESDVSELMACGDGLNDIPMLQCAGLAIAMENAYPETKAHADWVAPSNEEDGVAAAVEKFILRGEIC